MFSSVTSHDIEGRVEIGVATYGCTDHKNYTKKVNNNNNTTGNVWMMMMMWMCSWVIVDGGGWLGD